MAIDGVPQEMLAVQVVEFNKPYKVHKVPTPTTLGDHEMLLKPVVASLCHTDSVVAAGVFHTPLPCTASHEGTGIVHAVSAQVTRFQVGDRVMAGLPRNPCGTCVDCVGPDDGYQYCRRLEGYIGLGLDRAFAEYHVVDSRTSSHIPDDVGALDTGPLACAGCTTYRAIIVAEVREGDWLAIVGAGGV